MQRITAQQASEKWDISLRRVQDLCRAGKIPGAERFGTHWMLPADAVRPVDGRRKESRESAGQILMLPRRSPMLSMTDLYHTPGCADKASRTLKDPQARALFDANIAYARGEIDVVYDYAQYFLSKHTGIYAVGGATMLLCLCAIWRGDIQMWQEAKRHIAEAPCRNDLDREVLSLVLAAADSSVFDNREYPDWFERGNFEILPPDSHPAAKVYYAKLLYMMAFGVATRQHEMEGIQGLALMRMLPNAIEPMITQSMVDHTVIPQIYLRLLCATAYHNCGMLDLAREHVDKAIALALPDRLYGILAVHWRMLDQVLEERLALADPIALRETKELFRIFATGQESLRNKIRSRTVAAHLTDRERNIAKLVAFGMTNKRIADKLGISDSTVKSTIQKIMTKTGLTDRADFILVV